MEIPIKPKDLPPAGPLQNGHNAYVEKFFHHTAINGKKVLCIGFSEPEIDEYVARFGCLDITALTNWVGHRDAAVSKYPLVVGDITAETEFNAAEFDAVLTLSLFEHVADVAASMREIHRLLKPAGYCYAHLGPVWSNAFGHHIYANPSDRLLDFTSWQLPSHIHLLCTREDIAEYYRDSGYSNEQVAQALHWFFDTELINRVMFDDIARAFSSCFQMVAAELMFNEVNPDVLRLLRERYPGYIDFGTYGGTFLLRKPLAAR